MLTIIIENVNTLYIRFGWEVHMCDNIPWES
ncbi:MAG: hypothetical protein DKINENOH_03799 [bacterium]|nr:hypothetical protein [bacterium]